MLDSGLQRIFRKILTGDKDKNMHLFDEGNKTVLESQMIECNDKGWSVQVRIHFH